MNNNSGYEKGRIITDMCPRCGNEMVSEGVDNGIGYIYPPFHCFCGYSELCEYVNNETCKTCDQYQYCEKEISK